MIKRRRNWSVHLGHVPGGLTGLEGPAAVVGGAGKLTPTTGAIPVGRRASGPVELPVPVCGWLFWRLVDRYMLDLLEDMGSCAALGAG